jgi:YfiH family protein
VPDLERIEHPCGVVTWRSGLLAAHGFRHAFATRIGGVSAAPFDSMNLGIAQAPGDPDTDANVAENAARLMRAIGASPAAMVRVRQVHGAAVHACAGDERFGDTVGEADAIVSRHAGCAPCIRTADCVPVLVACPRTGAAAAVHAGWRGIVAGVVGRAVAALAREAGPGDASGFVAAVGPCAGRDRYEVGPEVAAEFAAAAGAAFVLPPGPGRRKDHIDCFGAVRAQLLAAGLAPDRVDGEERCTIADPRDFFSYRRDGARGGRLGSVIVPR